MALVEQLKDKPWYIGAIVGVVVGAIIVGLGWYALFDKQYKTLARHDSTLEKLQADIQKGRAAEQRLPQFREEVRRLELELEKLLRILPARLNTEDLLRRLRALAEQGDLELLRIRPGGLSNRDFYAEWPIAISVTGNYHNLALFFDRIGRFSRIINIDNLQVSARNASQGGNHTIAANFTAKTFVYRDVELNPDDQSGSGGGR